MTPDPKALKEARLYIPNILRVCVQDCSDSGERADEENARFNAFVDDKIGIGEFIAEHLRDEWVAELTDILKDSGSDIATFDEWPVCEPPKPLDNIKEMLRTPKGTKGIETKGVHSVRIYGTSDDLVELDGDVDEEISSFNQPTYLLFNDGSQIKIEYDPDKTACWRIEVVTKGDAAHSEIRKGIDEGESDVVPSAYSDLLVLTWDKPLELVKRGHRKLKMVPKDEATGMALAKKVIELLADRRGFDDWFHDIDEDAKNELMEELAIVLGQTIGGKPNVEKKTFAITGTLSLPRKDIVSLIEEAGHAFSSAIRVGVDYLVVGEDAGSKAGQARKMGIKTLDETELRKMMGVKP